MKWLNTALALFALFATAMAIVRWQTMGELRQAAAVAAPEATLPRTQSEVMAPSAAELEALREETKDLPGLRNEVRQLRAATNQLGALRDENDRLTKAKETGATISAPLPAGFVSKEQLANIGFATPEGAVQTFFWAMRETNFDRIVESWSGKMQEKERTNDPNYRARLEADFRRGSAEMMQRFHNIGVVQREQLSPTEQVLHLSSTYGKRAARIHLVLEGTEWKIDKFD